MVDPGYFRNGFHTEASPQTIRQGTFVPAEISGTTVYFLTKRAIESALVMEPAAINADEQIFPVGPGFRNMQCKYQPSL